MKIRLRYELWEYHDGLTYRRASQAENDRHRHHTEGLLRQVFYASSEAHATTQYQDLRGLQPYSTSDPELLAPFTRAELEAQFADFPEDTALAAQMWPRLKRKDIQAAGPDDEAAPKTHRVPAPRKPARGLAVNLLWLLMIGMAVAAVVVFVWPGVPLSTLFDPAATPNLVERVVSRT
jgi:hypothetical protein